MKPTRYMLDTDTFSYLVTNRYPAVREHVRRHQSKIVLSSITVAEALYGARKKGSSRLEDLIGLFQDLFAVIDWDAQAASAYADIRVALERAGTPIGNMDMMIAAVAKASGCVLVTNNQAHFSHVPDLVLENWVV